MTFDKTFLPELKYPDSLPRFEIRKFELVFFIGRYNQINLYSDSYTADSQARWRRSSVRTALINFKLYIFITPQ